MVITTEAALLPCSHTPGSELSDTQQGPWYQGQARVPSLWTLAADANCSFSPMLTASAVLPCSWAARYAKLSFVLLHHPMASPGPLTHSTTSPLRVGDKPKSLLMTASIHLSSVFWHKH